MKTEFVFRAPFLDRNHLVSLMALEKFFDDKIIEAARRDREAGDLFLVEIFDKRQGDIKSHPPLKSLGMMPVATVIQKFK